MNNNQRKEFSDLMDSVMPIYRMEASSATKTLWWNLLAGYELPDVANAFAEYLRSNKFAPTPADIVAMVDKLKPDGRPGADEAWSMIPRDEYASAVLNEEMMAALGIAQPLLNEGDQVAARMAFKEAYTRLVDSSKRAGTPVRWFPSLGDDKNGRESVLIEAVRLGRLPRSQVVELLPYANIPEQTQVAQLIGNSKLLKGGDHGRL
jgi:hypothetical protein